MENYIYQNTLINKKQLKELLAWSFSKYDSMQASLLADELKYLGFKYATQAGISISIEDLKAVFFVKDFEGNKDHKKKYDDVIHGAGRKIVVDFNDGESIIGYALSYSPDRQGFFMTPADLSGNNERAFIVKSATKNIKFL